MSEISKAIFKGIQVEIFEKYGLWVRVPENELCVYLTIEL